MSFHIVCDSCTDLTKEDFDRGCFTWIPLTLIVDGQEILDDETFDQADFLKKVAESTGEVKSACPAPEQYMEAYDKADDIYVVTLSAQLSGSYNSAVLGKNLYEEEKGKKNIYVFNSRGASTTQFLIAQKIYEYASGGMEFQEVVMKVEEYISTQRTYFVLETLEVLRRNGRLSGLTATLAGALGRHQRGDNPEADPGQGHEEGSVKNGRIYCKGRQGFVPANACHSPLQLPEKSRICKKFNRKKSGCGRNRDYRDKRRQFAVCVRRRSYFVLLSDFLYQ